MEVRVVARNLVELQLKPEEHYLTEDGINGLVKLLSKALFEMKGFGQVLTAAEKSGSFNFNMKGGD